MTKVRQGQKIPDKKRKAILKTFIENGNKAQTAREHGVSRTTVQNIAKEEEELGELMQQKKEDNSRAMLDELDDRVPQVLGIIDRLLKELENKEKIENTPLQQIATTMGIVIDKFTMRERLEKEGKQQFDGVVQFINDIPKD